MATLFSPLTLPMLFSLTILALVGTLDPATARTSMAGQTGEAGEADYELFVSFAPEDHLLIATARISLRPGSALNLDLTGLTVTGLLLREGGGRESVPLPAGSGLSLPPAAERRELFISYKARMEGSADNLIGPEGIALTDRWHPVPDKALRYRLQARLPRGFTAVVESDRFPLTASADIVTADFSQPLRQLHFAAGPYIADSLEVRRGLRVHSLFFEEDRELARPYLEAARRYLQRYEQEIGPYPYAHYVVVANRRPTGLGMPTFTLIGQQILRLPFIKETSLGHEILHSWFGNSVEVDTAGGNWCEGLTTFLADHAFRADRGQAAEDRKERIVGYLSYVNEQTAMPLSAFRSADHRQARAEAVRAVGYNRGALLFAELRDMLGPAVFTAAIRAFYREYRGKSASWDDLRQSFSRAAGRDLGVFFRERLDRATIPELAVSDIEVSQTEAGARLTFGLMQKGGQPFSLRVPVVVATASGLSRFVVTSDKAATPVSLTTDGLPLQFSIDPEYTFLRKLAGAELTPVWSRFLGAEKKLAILESEAARETFAPLLTSLADDAWTVKTADQMSGSELAGQSLLFLGAQSPLSRSLFARPNHPEAGFTLDVRRHPLAPGQVAVLVSAADRGETAAAARRLSHYGKYSLLHFERGRVTRQETAQTESGMQFVLEQLPAGAATASLSPFAAIVDQLDRARVVYVGETHTAMADHRLQLRIIEEMHRRNPDLAIGMEMFPAASQPALDAYTDGRAGMDEREFLKASRYFQVWRFDYRLYRDIVNLARGRRIPIVGLNLEREVVGTVFKTGAVDALPAEVRKSLPVDRDLDMPGYADGLTVLHDMHATGGHGNGSLGGFIQAQALWDETMAENIAGYLRVHPGRRMVVLAGSQHSRKDIGIPPRLLRRLPLDQATVMNVSAGEDAESLAAIADYFFVSPPRDLPEAGMMGIVLESQRSGDRDFLLIGGFSPESRADEAGLAKGDVLLSIDGLAVREMDDVRIALLDARPGRKIEVEIERGEKKGSPTKRMRFTVELIAPPAGPAHP